MRSGEDIRAYHCEFCGNYHIGHKETSFERTKKKSSNVKILPREHDWTVTDSEGHVMTCRTCRKNVRLKDNWKGMDSNCENNT